ncbi:hypothetical protein FACS189481_3130 [Clostridia bacterium]|nr:hypothetical protein FACS189481_3130 [Clostridia bacterium]
MADLQPNKNKFHWLVLFSSVLFIALSCYGFWEVYQRFGSPEVAEMTGKVTGCLTLSSGENKKVSALVRKILSLKNNSSSNKQEINELNTLNITLDELLNRYTLEKMKETTPDFSDVKATMKKYKYGACTAWQDTMAGFSNYKVIGGSKIQWIASGMWEETPELEENINKTWENVKKIFPTSALKNIAFFAPFTAVLQKMPQQGSQMKMSSEVKGFMIPDFLQIGSTLGINIDASDLEELSYILYHEYGHAISLGSSQHDSRILGGGI